MASISIKEARQKFAELVEAARCGSVTTITRRGRNVARLTGANERKGQILPDLTEFRASLKVKRKSRVATIEKLRNNERY